MLNYLCITVDGLHNGMIGAYGNGWVRTPTFDLLATEGVVFDRFYAKSTDLATIFDAMWGALPKNFREKGYRTILLTDDSDVFHHASAVGFSEVHRLDAENVTVPADSVEKTLFFEAFATAVDLLVSKKDAPYFLWLHLRGFRGPWDFPLEERKSYQAEDDPEPYAGIAPPWIDAEEELDPDDLQAVMEAYGGGVTVLDAALGGLLDSLQEGELGGDTLLLVGSTRGFALGEHRRIGADERLYGENIHLPLLVRFSDGFGATVRSPILFQPSDLRGFLENLNEPGPSEPGPNEPGPVVPVLKELIAEERESYRETLTVHGERGESVLITPEWFVRRTPTDSEHGEKFRTELYVKPDDRWEVNDVADRCREVLEDFADRTRGATRFPLRDS